MLRWSKTALPITNGKEVNLASCVLKDNGKGVGKHEGHSFFKTPPVLATALESEESKKGEKTWHQIRNIPVERLEQEMKGCTKI